MIKLASYSSSVHIYFCLDPSSYLSMLYDWWLLRVTLFSRGLSGSGEFIQADSGPCSVVRLCTCSEPPGCSKTRHSFAAAIAGRMICVISVVTLTSDTRWWVFGPWMKSHHHRRAFCSLRRRRFPSRVLIIETQVPVVLWSCYNIADWLWLL